MGGGVDGVGEWGRNGEREGGYANVPVLRCDISVYLYIRSIVVSD